MDIYGSKRTEKYIHLRLEQVGKLHISSDHKLEKLEKMMDCIKSFRRGMITEDELLWLIG